MLNVKVINNLPSAAKIMKNINFGTASGLTKTAKQGQDAVLGALRGTFTLRTQWYKPTNKVGIKITAAKPNKLEASVHTAAKFLHIHEDGGVKIPYGNYIAVPTSNAQPDKKRRIPQRNLPKNLKKAFIIKGRSGTLLCVREQSSKRAKRVNWGGIVPMYVLIKKATIKKGGVFRDPIKKVVDRNLKKNIAEGISDAIRTMR